MSYKELKDINDVSLGFLPESKEGGRLRNVIYMTASGNYVKPAWLKFVRVKGVGAGGGRGGTDATTAITVGASGGAGAGGYFEKRIEAASLAASEVVTVGDAGLAGVSGNSTGGTGGTTSFGSHCSATGGIGSLGSVAASALSGGGTGGDGVGGDLNISGGYGLNSRVIYDADVAIIQIIGAAGTSMMGGNSSGYGSGAQGRTIGNSTAASVGLAGRPGILIIEEYE